MRSKQAVLDAFESDKARLPGGRVAGGLKVGGPSDQVVESDNESGDEFVRDDAGKKSVADTFRFATVRRAGKRLNQIRALGGAASRKSLASRYDGIVTDESERFVAQVIHSSNLMRKSAALQCQFHKPLLGTMGKQGEAETPVDGKNIMSQVMQVMHKVKVYTAYACWYDHVQPAKKEVVQVKVKYETLLQQFQDARQAWLKEVAMLRDELRKHRDDPSFHLPTSVDVSFYFDVESVMTEKEKKFLLDATTEKLKMVLQRNPNLAQGFDFAQLERLQSKIEKEEIRDLRNQLKRLGEELDVETSKNQRRHNMLDQGGADKEVDHKLAGFNKRVFETLEFQVDELQTNLWKEKKAHAACQEHATQVEAERADLAHALREEVCERLLSQEEVNRLQMHISTLEQQLQAASRAYGLLQKQLQVRDGVVQHLEVALQHPKPHQPHHKISKIKPKAKESSSSANDALEEHKDNKDQKEQEDQKEHHKEHEKHGAHQRRVSTTEIQGPTEHPVRQSVLHSSVPSPTPQSAHGRRRRPSHTPHKAASAVEHRKKCQDHADTEELPAHLPAPEKEEEHAGSSAGAAAVAGDQDLPARECDMQGHPESAGVGIENGGGPLAKHDHDDESHEQYEAWLLRAQSQARETSAAHEELSRANASLQAQCDHLTELLHQHVNNALAVESEDLLDQAEDLDDIVNAMGCKSGDNLQACTCGALFHSEQDAFCAKCGLSQPLTNSMDAGGQSVEDLAQEFNILESQHDQAVVKLHDVLKQHAEEQSRVLTKEHRQEPVVKIFELQQNVEDLKHQRDFVEAQILVKHAQEAIVDQRCKLAWQDDVSEEKLGADVDEQGPAVLPESEAERKFVVKLQSMCAVLATKLKASASDAAALSKALGNIQLALRNGIQAAEVSQDRQFDIVSKFQQLTHAVEEAERHARVKPCQLGGDGNRCKTQRKARMQQLLEKSSELLQMVASSQPMVVEATLQDLGRTWNTELTPEKTPEVKQLPPLQDKRLSKLDVKTGASHPHSRKVLPPLSTSGQEVDSRQTHSPHTPTPRRTQTGKTRASVSVSPSPTTHIRGQGH